MAYVGQASNYAVGPASSITVTRSVTSGNYLLVVVDSFTAASTTYGFATTSGTTSAWTEIAAADVYDATDDYEQEAAWATVTTTGSVTVTVSMGGPVESINVLMVECSGITAFDAAQYARQASPTGGTAGLTNTNATATRLVYGVAWGGGNVTATSPYTDGGALTGAYSRVQYIEETSGTSRTGAFGAGATAPVHITQFIFTASGGGGGGTPVGVNVFNSPIFNSRIF